MDCIIAGVCLLTLIIFAALGVSMIIGGAHYSERMAEIDEEDLAGPPTSAPDHI